MRTNITPPRHDRHAPDWTDHDERISLRLAAVTTWAVVAFVVAVSPGTATDLIAVTLGGPAALTCWHLGETVGRRRARAAIRYARSLRNLEEREHLGLLDRDAQLDAEVADLRRNPFRWIAP